MACTTILVGKGASYDGSTMMARNDDSGSGSFAPKKLTVVKPGDQPRHYKSVISHVEIDLPDDPLRYTAVPNAVRGEGIWAGSGINEKNVAMTATETITTNPRVLGADPLVVFEKGVTAEEAAADGTVEKKEKAGGIGEEDLVTLVLPYISSAREGVKRLGALLQEYGTYETNGIGFSDRDEIWWFETIGGHHWMARRVPDRAYVVMPNQLGIDKFDFRDAMGEQKEYMCSPDLLDFVNKNHLDLTNYDSDEFSPRLAFGSLDDADHVYNTPRAWYMGRYFNPHTVKWDGPDADYTPESDDIPWCFVPERKITVEDVKYILSSHYQGTPYDPYGSYGEEKSRGAYRSIGVNRTDFMAILQLRPYMPDECMAVEWLAFGSNVFNVAVPLYADTDKVPAYLGTTDADVSTDSFYWTSRLIAALADAAFSSNINYIEHYQEAVASKGHEIINRYDGLMAAENDPGKKAGLRDRANEELAEMLKKESVKALNRVLYGASNHMKNQYARSDH